MMLDTRSSPEASGFQSLFASATQHTRGSDGYPTVPSPAEKFSGSAESAGVGNRRKAASKTSGDSGGLGSALAGLAIPPPAAIRSQEWAPSDGKNDEVALVGTAGSSSSQAAGPTAAANFRLDTRFIWPGETKTGDAGSLDNPQIPPLSDFAGSVASASKDANGIEAPLFGDLGGETKPGTKTADSLDAAAVQIGTQPESHAAPARSSGHKPSSPDSGDAGHRKEAAGMAESSESITSAGSSLPPANQIAGTGLRSAMGSADPASQPSSFAGSAMAPTADPNKTPKPDTDASLPGADAVAAAPTSHSAFVVAATAATQSVRDQKGNSTADPQESSPGAGGFPGAVQSTPSLQTAAPGASQAIAAPTPHSPSSLPPSEHAEAPSPRQPDATPASALPALQTTQVLQRMDKAEIHIGLQSTDFGAIRLHTTVASDQVGAAVSTSHPGLRDALLVEAPSLEKAMARHSLRLDSFSIGTGSANSNSNSFGSDERQPAGTAASSNAAWPAARPQPSQSEVAPTPGPLKGSSRLDVRA